MEISNRFIYIQILYFYIICIKYTFILYVLKRNKCIKQDINKHILRYKKTKKEYEKYNTLT